MGGPGDTRDSSLPRAQAAICRVLLSEPAPRVVYECAANSWWLSWPCDVCGGADLPLEPRRSLDGSPHPEEVPHVLPCPRCEACRRRLEPAGAEPAVWYDTALGDWVVRVPCRPPGVCALLPLEIGWFDAPWAAVYRAASDVVNGGDEFEDVDADLGPAARRPRSPDAGQRPQRSP
jgi:hypothetical protein